MDSNRAPEQSIAVGAGPTRFSAGTVPSEASAAAETPNPYADRDLLLKVHAKWKELQASPGYGDYVRLRLLSKFGLEFFHPQKLTSDQHALFITAADKLIEELKANAAPGKPASARKVEPKPAPAKPALPETTKIASEVMAAVHPTPAPVGGFVPGHVHEQRQPQPEEIVERFLTRAPLILWYGLKGSAKTFGVIDMFGAVARGAPWHGRRTRKMPVAYIAAEDAAGVGLRHRGYRLRHKLAETGISILGAAPDLLNVDAVDALRRSLRAWHEAWPTGADHGVLVIDTLSWCLPGAAENDPGTMSRARHVLMSLAIEFDLSIVVVHHSDKAGRTPRLHSTFMFGVDAILKSERHGKRFTLAVEFQRNGPAGQRFNFRLETIAIEGTPNGTCTVQETDGPDSDYKPVPKQPSGDNLKRVYAAIKLLIPEVGSATVSQADIVQMLKDGNPKAKRDPIFNVIPRTLRGLAKDGWIEFDESEKWVRRCK